MVPSALRLNCTELTKSVSSLFLLIVDNIYSIFFKGEGCDSDLEAAEPDEDKSRVKRQVASNDLKLELFSFDATLFANNKEAYFCGATLITDK